MKNFEIRTSFKHYAWLALPAALFISGCKKGDDAPVSFQEGEYMGSGIVISGTTVNTRSEDVTFKSGSFTSALINETGTYTLKGDTVIHFKSNVVIAPNAIAFITFVDDFQIQHKGDSVILTKVLQPGLTTFQLRLALKQNGGN